MDERLLHPNLARLAAEYDAILARFERAEIDVDKAKALVSNLVARDDQGVRWSINPDDGEWYYQTIDGRLVQGTPPSFGVATPTAAEVSAGFDNRYADRVRRSPIDPKLLLPPQGLAGATWVAAGADSPIRSAGLPRWARVVLGAAAAALVAVAAMQLRETDEPAPVEQPTATTVAG